MCEPNSTSNYSAVCSLHFLQTDFPVDTKRRLLKPGTMPSVFLHYPSYMKKEPPKVRSCSSIQKRKRDSSTDTLASLTASQKAHSRLAPASDALQNHVNVPAAVTEPNSQRASESVPANYTDDQLPSLTSNNDCLKSASFPVSAYVQLVEEAGARALRSFGTQADLRASTSAFLERKKWREKERTWKKRNERLQATVDAYKEELHRLKEACNVNKFLQVARESNQGSTKVRLIMDQVLNYKAKKPKCETTIRQCVILRNLSTKSYEYIRTELLALPSRTTLQKFLGALQEK
ncbi:hypothetical protein HPB50_010518 [Hyalomma asiaticum]|uniref:Uncharacterized protein n=1 Tax=Hyalomma asiaticum TaxID=266040 RepID=A0ACB7SXJ7_HYAAI|nr:hypothetical protein HPB50_010518 [Hyalomma asiaticum]